MATTRIHLVRHGEVESRWSGRLYGDLDVELSDLGREQAERAAELLRERPLVAVVSSDLVRARYGAECIGRACGISPQQDTRLREISRGEWAGRPVEELRSESPGALEAWFEAPEDRRPPGGESIGDVRTRVLAGLRDLVERHAGDELAVVAHGWVIRSTLGWVLGLPATSLTRLHIPPASIATIDWHPEHASAEDVPSLDGPHRGTPNLVGIQVDRTAPDSRGWYRSPAKATS